MLFNEELTKKNDQNKPKVSIIMVNYNGMELLKNAIESIVTKTAYPNFEFILVDNGSVDGSVEFVKEYYPWIRLICNSENKGFAKANNQGILASESDYCVLLNTDIEIYTQNWLTMLVDIMENNEQIGILSCAQPCSKDAIINIDSRPLHEVSSVDGAVFMIRRKTIKNIGLLDEIFTPCYFEDTDWCARASMAGWKVAADHSIIVIHYGGTTSKKVFAKLPLFFHIYARNRLIYALMNHSITKIPGDLATEVLELCSVIFIGSAKERIYKINLWMRARKEVASKLKHIIAKRRSRRLIKAQLYY